MKYLPGIIFLIISFFNLTITDVLSHGPTRQKIKESITINAKPEDVWNLIKDFEKIDIWHPSISKVESDGKTRTIYYSLRNNTPITY